MISWYKLPDLPDGLSEVKIEGKTICISSQSGNVHACSAKCPHAGGALVDGYVDFFGNIVCPVHHYRFSLSNGRNSSGEGYFLKTYQVEEREDGWYVGI